MATHEILNQPPPLTDCNLFSSDRALGDVYHKAAAGIFLWFEQRRPD